MSVRSAVERVRRELAIPGASVQPGTTFRGAVNAVLQLRVSGWPGVLALRRRHERLPSTEDGRLAKDGLCARLITDPADLAPANLRTLLSERGGEDAASPVAPHVHLYRHAGPEEPWGAWSLSDWIEGPRLIDRPDAHGFGHLGAAMARLHSVRSALFFTEWRPDQPRDWSGWCSAMLRHCVEKGHAMPDEAEVRTALSTLPPPPEPGSFALLHGDIHPANAIVTAEGVRLIDWDEAHVGPPEMDLVLLRYRTVPGEAGELVADADAFGAVVNGYLGAGGRMDPEILTWCEILWLAKHFRVPEADRPVSLRRGQLAARLSALVEVVR